MYGEISAFARSLGAKVIDSAPMSEYTSFKAGGYARMLIEPVSADSLAKIIAYLNCVGMDFLVIGNGSNLLVADEGYEGVVIKLGSSISEMRLVSGNEIYCEAGASMKALCRYAAENALSGLECEYGIPGTVGGAVYMNAGAYGGEMRDVLVSCRHIDLNGSFFELTADKMDLGYRKSIYMSQNYTVVSAVVRLEKGNKEDIKTAMNGYLARRREKQPLEFPSAGSTFKRPEGHFAGALIEQCGLKGFQVGGAQVSEKHAGFVINRGGATAGDILALMSEVRRQVYEKFGVILEPEVQIIGGGDKLWSL